MTVSVRRAVPGDVSHILDMIVALAVYEQEPDAVKATEDSLGQTLFGPNPQVFVHIAEQDGKAIGLALWFLTYSTWTGRPSLYLEDLFVADSARGDGVGRMLLAALAREAKALGCARMDWAVLDWNEKARGFYMRIGAHHSTGWEPWRIEGEALERLAANG
ncbi:GNAT family N-acetyltransferase [Sphingobium boeckii]|uniref:GNAT superfamily N-acetyltransferase n=1 Tax=Sphingobium boeckii TaxID=1082345 RepID=A0A7W9AFM9_9SPHN|nr:GNAT family N-acetyltransferase [Sphingobium boeckii]MBB5684571.1 GNAT superfamily N-acetyltransferase [Sphingobium boeckii]